MARRPRADVRFRILRIRTGRGGDARAALVPARQRPRGFLIAARPLIAFAISLPDLQQRGRCAGSASVVVDADLLAGLAIFVQAIGAAPC